MPSRRSSAELDQVDRIVGIGLRVGLAVGLLCVLALLIASLPGCASSPEEGGDTPPVYQPLSLQFEAEGGVEVIGRVEHEASVCLNHVAVVRLGVLQIPLSLRACYVTLAGPPVQHCTWLRAGFPWGSAAGVIAAASTPACVDALGAFAGEPADPLDPPPLGE